MPIRLRIFIWENELQLSDRKMSILPILINLIISIFFTMWVGPSHILHLQQYQNDSLIGRHTIKKRLTQ